MGTGKGIGKLLATQSGLVSLRCGCRCHFGWVDCWHRLAQLSGKDCS